jgi:glutaredoxin-related protein
MNVILYSTHCPKCDVLADKLKQKNIQYTEVNDIKIMSEKGFEFMPMLEVDGTVYDFKNAVNWVNGDDKK